MIWLIKFLIFGPQCKHKWKLVQSMDYYVNDHMYLYHCTECGKVKKTRMHMIVFD